MGVTDSLHLRWLMFKWLISENLAQQIKNYERSHILSKSFLFFSTLHFLRCSVHGARVLICHYFPTDSSAALYGHLSRHIQYKKQPGNPCEAKKFKCIDNNIDNTYCVQRLYLFFITLEQTHSCFLWGLTNSKYSLNVD